MPDGLEDTKRFLIPVESTTVSVNDEEPETVTVTESEAVCGPLELKKILLLPSITLTVYVVVALGVAVGLALPLPVIESTGVHMKIYGGAPPVVLACSFEVSPVPIVVGSALTETFNGKTVVTKISP
jgi:hypothetical protein